MKITLTVLAAILILATPVQATETMFDFMYEELPEAMQEQKETAITYKDTGGGH